MRAVRQQVGAPRRVRVFAALAAAGALAGCATTEFAPAGFSAGPERVLAGVVTELCFDAPLDLIERGAAAGVRGYTLRGEATDSGARYANEDAFLILGFIDRDGMRVHQCTVAAADADLGDAERVVAAVAEERGLSLAEPTEAGGYRVHRFAVDADRGGALMTREGLVADEGFDGAASVTVMLEEPL